MKPARFLSDLKMVYCICPYCKTSRKLSETGYTIIKRGYERNGLTRFFCRGCQSWFNERTGDSMRWLER
ncbi:hypothetical protein COV20_03800 [Candidatus Woesearchaeota archaeon CG10_big_fil_rev_8_21_14_0_10_45_16]|nr:MAG: hypothetical protein COV20_03800 [Candidatus Woesearchaeota archaeon CG10_big_fil_rev_8_21_14_0_10_45_16]